MPLVHQLIDAYVGATSQHSSKSLAVTRTASITCSIVSAGNSAMSFPRLKSTGPFGRILRIKNLPQILRLVGIEYFSPSLALQCEVAPPDHPRTQAERCQLQTFW